MATWKVAYFTGIGARPSTMLEQAPGEIEVIVVDRDLPDSEKIGLCRDADALITSDVSTSVLQECPRVKLVQTLSAGYDRLDLEAILEMGIPVANNGGANAIPVSEQTIALMIGINRNLMAQWDSTTRRRGVAKQPLPDRPVGSHRQDGGHRGVGTYRPAGGQAADRFRYADHLLRRGRYPPRMFSARSRRRLCPLTNCWRPPTSSASMFPSPGKPGA